MVTFKEFTRTLKEYKEFFESAKKHLGDLEIGPSQAGKGAYIKREVPQNYSQYILLSREEAIFVINNLKELYEIS